VRSQLRAELCKQRSIRTGIGLFAAMLGLVVFAVALHGFGVAAENVGSTSSEQLTRLFGPGEKLGAVFAGLFGALAITSEIRHGTIRPTFLVSPWRSRVIAAKVLASTLIGTGFGLAACALAAGVATAALRLRGVDVQVDGGDYALFLVGGAAAAGLWAAIGVGLGAIVRNQVPTLIGICAWLLFVEGLLLSGLADIGGIGRFAPGAAAAAISGQDPGTLLAPALGLVLLAFYAVAAALTGSLATSRRDVA
jgi:ABC-type transport system involved in multi-copper enzyme maturation permease subunit